MYRALSVLIVIFWLTMTALLLRNEVKPGDSSLREVPTAHVVKLILHHQQVSELNITSEKKPLGHVRIAPRTDPETDQRIIAFVGNVHFVIPGTRETERVAWDGEVEMDKDLTVQRVRLGVTMHEPARDRAEAAAGAPRERDKLRSEIVIQPAKNIAHYQLTSANGILDQHDYTLDERGAHDVLKQFEIDPAMWPAMTPNAHTKPPVIKAQQSSIEVQGERMDTYLVTIESNGQTWLEFHVNQLGQIVRASTLLGYDLSPGDLSP